MKYGMVIAPVLALVCTAQAEMLTFDLHEAQGRRVRSQDYKGRPLFLEFGACW